MAARCSSMSEPAWCGSTSKCPGWRSSRTSKAMQVLQTIGALDDAGAVETASACLRRIPRMSAMTPARVMLAWCWAIRRSVLHYTILVDADGVVRKAAKSGRLPRRRIYRKVRPAASQ